MVQKENFNFWYASFSVSFNGKHLSKQMAGLAPPTLNTNRKFKVQLTAAEPRNIWKFSLALNRPQRIHCYNSRTPWLWPNSVCCEQFRSLCFQPERRTAEVHKNWDVAANMVFRIFEKTRLTAASAQQYISLSSASWHFTATHLLFLH